MKYLVTGGGGFLGGAVVKVLQTRGDDVVSFSRNQYPELEKSGVCHISGDLNDGIALKNAASGCDGIFHVAAKAGVWGPWNAFYSANVTGTERVIEVCRTLGISRLVYTSSPSVVFHGGDMEGVDEGIGYPDHYETHYPATKAMAEQSVISANDDELATVTLRPHLIWGPGDPHLVARIVARGKAGKLRKIGAEPKLIDSVYVDNAAQAHVNAMDRLTPGSKISGKTYFITNGEPMPVWELVNGILAAAGVQPVVKTISPKLAYAAGAVLETIYKLFRIKNEPMMTRFVARELSTAHWFNIDAARRDLDYDPEVSIDEGLERLQKWFEATGIAE